MFTGIIEEIGIVKSVKSKVITIEANKIFDDLKLGDSVAVNGTCLTISSFSNKIFNADITTETLSRTNLGDLKSGFKVNLKELIKILGEEKNIDSVLIEGGSILHASLLKEKLIDKALIYIAPKIFGGLNAKTPISGKGIENPGNAIKLIDGNIEKIGEDLFMEYYLKY